MTITFLAPDGVAVTAMAERQARATLRGGGSGRQLGGRSGFRVGTPSNILTATSTTWTLGVCAIGIDANAVANQGVYDWATDANVSGAVTASDATYTRRDIVYIQISDDSAGDGTGAKSAPVQYLAGIADATGAAPALPPRSFLVGTITVPPGTGTPSVVRNPAVCVAAGAALPVSSVTERDALVKYDGLSVLRLDLQGRPVETWDVTGNTWVRSGAHVEFTYSTAAGAIPNATTWGPGALTLDSTTISTDTTLASTPSADKVTIAKAGTYAIWFGGAFGHGLTGASWFQIKNSADTEVYASSAASDFWGSVSIPNFRVTADNTTIWFRLKQTSGNATNSTGRIRITRIG